MTKAGNWNGKFLKAGPPQRRLQLFDVLSAKRPARNYIFFQVSVPLSDCPLQALVFAHSGGFLT